MKKESPREKKQDKENRKIAIKGKPAVRKSASHKSSTSRGDEFIQRQSDQKDINNDTQNADYDKAHGVKE